MAGMTALSAAFMSLSYSLFAAFLWKSFVLDQFPLLE